MWCCKSDKIMEIEIKITIKPETPSEFDKRQLISDIKWQFAEITGFEINEIEVNEK